MAGLLRLCASCLLITAVFSATSDELEVKAIVDLAESQLDSKDCEDMLSKALFADWNTSNPKSLIDCMKSLGYHFQDSHKGMVKELSHGQSSSEDPLMTRRIELLKKPGDILLPTAQWNQLVNYSVMADHNLDRPRDAFCDGEIANCLLSSNRDSKTADKFEKMARFKHAWQQMLPDEEQYLRNILPLVRKAAEVNGFPNPKEYWNALTEYNGAVDYAGLLWTEIEPLYLQLLTYIRTRKFLTDFQQQLVSTEHLGSLLGDDWSEIARYVIPRKGAEAYKELYKNIRKNKIGGENAYKAANELLSTLQLGSISPKFWENSDFNSHRPNHLLRAPYVAVRTSSEPSTSAFAQANEFLANALHEENVNKHSDNTFIFRQPQRYSALYTALGGLVELAGWSKVHLENTQLLTDEYYTEDSKNLILLLQALKDLPRLAYAHCTDSWRLKRLDGENIKYSDHIAQCMNLRTGPKDYLGDHKVLWNEPYTGEFLGTVLKYQLYQKFVMEAVSEDSVTDAMVLAKDQIQEVMGKGYSQKWPEFLPELLNGQQVVESSALLDHFKPLKEFLDEEKRTLTPDVVSDILEDFPGEEVELVPNENTGDQQKAGNLTRLPDADQPGKAQPVEPASTSVSYTPFIWIAVGLALALLLIAFFVIMRRRKSHKRNLERERITRA